MFCLVASLSGLSVQVLTMKCFPRNVQVVFRLLSSMDLNRSMSTN